MEQSINIWGIKEFEGDGQSCPIVPVNLPIHKKIVLFFFRFGVCPMCITLSLGYNVVSAFRQLGAKLGISNKKQNSPN
jgi:peroxiredoxin